jgi:hypothetical protein
MGGRGAGGYGLAVVMLLVCNIVPHIFGAGDGTARGAAGLKREMAPCM